MRAGYSQSNGVFYQLRAQAPRLHWLEFKLTHDPVRSPRVAGLLVRVPS